MTDSIDLTPKAVTLLKVQAKLLEALELMPEEESPSLLFQTIIEAVQATSEALADLNITMDYNPFFKPA